MGGLSMLLLAGEHALTAQEVRNSLLSLTTSSKFKEFVRVIFDQWGMKVKAHLR